MIVIILLVWLLVVVFQLVVLSLLFATVFGLVKSLCRRPKTFIEFLDFYIQFWSDLCCKIFLRKKDKKNSNSPLTTVNE